MMRYTEDDFFSKIIEMIHQKRSLQDISKQSLNMMNLSINWRIEVRYFALDLINLTEEQFEMTYSDILNEIKKIRHHERQ